MKTALKFITCGSVDDGKSTLIGRLLLDSQAVMRDQLDAVSRTGTADLALLTDGLSAEREQGITIDVAWRYFATPKRKFIIGDTPGHEQYTRNMVTAASGADCAVVLVDVTKLAWSQAPVALLAQTRRHALLCHLLRVRHIVFAINKLDAMGDNAQTAFENVDRAVRLLASEAGFTPAAVLPVSGLAGDNILTKNPLWSWYSGPALLPFLEQLPIDTAAHSSSESAALAVQWVEKTASSAATTAHGRRIAWGRVSRGALRVGDTLDLSTASGQVRAVKVARLLDTVRRDTHQIDHGHSAGVIFDAEIDVSRGDWLIAQPSADPALEPKTTQTLKATVSWLDDEPLVSGRMYWALHGHAWVKAKISRVTQAVDIQTFKSSDAEPGTPVRANDIAQVEISLSGAIPVLPFIYSRAMGSMILVDPASNKTAAAVLVH